MKFYTNCALHKGRVLLRGYENGERFQREAYYQPYLFHSTNERSPFKSIDGKNVKKKYLDNFGEARNFLNQYSGVGGMQIYGQDAFLYTFLYDTYPGEVKYNKDHINIVSIDIEIAADAGFPSI